MDTTESAIIIGMAILVTTEATPQIEDLGESGRQWVIEGGADIFGKVGRYGC